MSKAFTSEETPEAGPLSRPAPRLAPGAARYVTPEGHRALRDALESLRAERTAAAALPESQRAGRVADIDARVALAEATLAALTVLGPAVAPPGTVGFGTWVTVEDERGRRSTWRVVGPDEADARGGLVSVHSPVGRALLGCAVGDRVEVERPGGPAALVVVDVRHSAPGPAPGS